MLLTLRIQNLAIIDELDVDFSPGLNILTGETGAGKSIVLGALNLILGGRASADDIRSGSDRARVEAIFNPRGLARARDWLSSRGLETGGNEGLLVAREIARSGRGRCFISGSLVPLAILRELGDQLVDIHGQHQHQSLLAVESHLEGLDNFARTEKPRECVAALHEQWLELGERLAVLSRDERELERYKDMLAFQVREIEAAQLEAGEDGRLEQEQQRLAHAETLSKAARHAEDLLIEGEAVDTTVTSLFARIEQDLAEIARCDASMAPLADELRDARFQLEDLAFRLRQYHTALDPDPARLEEIEDRLDLIRRLKRKYGATIEDILALGQKNRGELDGLEHRDEEIEKVRAERDTVVQKLGKACEDLSIKRRGAARQLEKALVRVLADLNMPHTRFSVAMEREPAEPGEGALIEGRYWRVDAAAGVDRVEFLISPNPGEDLKPLRKIASGGELSRIMLALKSLIAKADRIPTLVFDEIDVGIGGAAADRVGEKMAELSKTHQILCITHLPQIAARAKTHFAVEKKVAGKRAQTRVRRLDDDERPAELARLLEGAEVTDLGRRHAAEMIRRAENEPRSRSRK